MNSVNRFSNKILSAAYAKFRPVYPKEVMTIIKEYMEGTGNPGFNFAVDVACGSGQSTFLLSDSYQRVTGVDISNTQIEQALLKKESSNCCNVEFLVGDAHRLLFKESSVYLLTCAMGWHWLHPETFYTEAKRVLKPGGCLAVYGHGVQVHDNNRISNAFKMFNDELFEYDCFPEQNLHVLNNYKAVDLPFKKVQRVEFLFPQESNFEQLLGLFSSVSMYSAYCKKYPNNTLLQRIRAKYEDDSQSGDIEHFTFPGFVILGIN